MIVIRALCQGRQEGFIDPHWHHLCGSIPKRLSTALAEPLDVVPRSASSAQSLMSCSVTGLPFIFSTPKS